MALDTASLRSAFSRFRLQAELLGLAVLVIVAAVVVGRSARQSASSMATELGRLRSSMNEVSDFRSAFRADSVTFDSVPLPDSLHVAVPHDARISLAQRIASLGEGSGLNNVRVKLGPADTAAAPTRPELASNPAIANYTLALYADGRFSSLLSLMKRLPPSVALQHVVMKRRADGDGQYELVLAVFEAAGQGQHG